MIPNKFKMPNYVLKIKKKKISENRSNLVDH